MSQEDIVTNLLIKNNGFVQLSTPNYNNENTYNLSKFLEKQCIVNTDIMASPKYYFIQNGLWAR